MTGRNFATKKFPDAGEMKLGGQASRDGSAPGWQLIEDRNVKVAVKSEGKRARNGRGGQNKHMGRITMPGGLVHETLALQDAKAMLLVDGHEAEAAKLDVIFNESMCADDELCFAGANSVARSGFFGGLQATDEELDSVAPGSQNAPRRKEMLHGENFRGGHESSLAAIFHGNDGGLQSYDGFPTAHVALKQPIHRHRLFEVSGDFGENAFLRVGRFEGEDALQSFANFVLADAKGNGVFLANGPAAKCKTELIQKKLLEDEALLGG